MVWVMVPMDPIKHFFGDAEESPASWSGFRLGAVSRVLWIFSSHCYTYFFGRVGRLEEV
jgi:hypothetical protein